MDDRLFISGLTIVSVHWVVYTTSLSRRHGSAATVDAPAAEFITRDVS